MKKGKTQNNQKRVYTIVGAAIILILLILVLNQTSVRDFTFEEGFNEIVKLDEKYETSLKTENIPNELINYKNVDPFVKDLTILREEVILSADRNPTKEKDALLLLIDARTFMILSEKSYTTAIAIGPMGLSDDEEGFSCGEAGYLINGAYYLNKSYGAGLEAYLKLDKLLGHNQFTPGVWDLVGVNDEKPRFFYSKLGDLKIKVARNLIALEEFCLIDMSQGLISPVNPEDYILINNS